MINHVYIEELLGASYEADKVAERVQIGINKNSANLACKILETELNEAVDKMQKEPTIANIKKVITLRDAIIPLRAVK